MNLNDPSLSPILPSYPTPQGEGVKGTEAAGVPLPVYKDAMSASGQAAASSFSYGASAQMAVLPQPTKAGEKGIGIPEQRVIQNFYSKQALPLLEEYELNAEEEEAVSEALLQGKEIQDPRLAQIVRDIRKKMKDYSVTEIVTPQAVAEEESQMVLSNLEDLTTHIESAMNKVILTLPNTSEGRSQGDYLKTLAEAIRGLKELLQELQLQDAEITEKVSSLKFDQVKARLENLEKAKKERMEMEEKKRSQEKLSKFFKIFGPVISALTVIVGAALSIFGGVGIGIIIAGVAVGTAMTTYSIVDGETGLTQNLMTALNNALESWFPGDDNVLARAGMKALLIAAAIVVLACALVVGGGSIAANITSQVARQAITETGKQIAIQTSIMAVMSSNVFPELVSSSLIQSGAISKDDAKAKMIVEMIAMVLTMLAVLAAVSYASKTRPQPPPNNDGAAALQEANQNLQGVMDRAAQSVKGLPRGIVNNVQDFGRGLANEAGNVKGMFVGANKLQSGLAVFQTSLRMTGTSMQMYESISRGKLGLELKRLLEALGEVELAEDLTQALIRVLEQLLQNLQSDLASQGDWMVSLQETLNDLLGTSRDNVTNLYTQA